MALAFLRRQQWWLKWFLAAVILSFIILYIPAFMGQNTGAPGETLARVGDLTITIGEFQRAYLQQRQRLEQIYQGRLDAALLRRIGLEQQVLNSLLSDRLVVLETGRLGLAVSDEEVADAIARMPGLQENGRFVGAAEYRRRLELQGRSVPEFEEQVRRGLLRQKLEALVSDGLTVTPKEAEREFRRRTEQIKAEYVLVDPDRFRSQVSVTPEEVRARFESRREAYRVPERRIASYALIDRGALAARAELSDREIEAYFQDHRDEFRQGEEACASHILIKVKGEGLAEGHTDADAKAIAEGLLTQLKAGADFATLARKASEDKGSAANGGSLGCFPRGVMKPEFEAAAFALGRGETSDLVRTDYGYHLIRLDDHHEETALPLSQVKERIRQTLREERVETLLEEKVQAVSRLLAGGKSLEVAAREGGVSVARSGPISRSDALDTEALARAAGPLASPALVARLFALKPGEADRDGLSVRQGYAFITLAEIQPAHLPELKEAEARIKADFEREKALDRARGLATELAARAAAQGLEKAAAGLGLVRKETPGFVGRGQPLGELPAGAALEDAAYTLPVKTLSEPVRAGAGYAVLRVLDRKPFDPAAFEKQKASLTASLLEEKRDRLFQAYMQEARARFPIEQRAEALRRVVGG